MIETAVFDTKPYDREYLARAAGAERVAWRFHEFRLSAETASAAKGARAVCIFVNDQADRACLETLAALGVKLIALRCAGYNNVDVAAARALGLAVVRVPAYSPHAVAEHTVGLLLTLNRKIHRAYNRVRELNFSLSGLVGFDLHGKTVGIVGTGRIGRITAQIFRGFEAEVIAHDPFPALDWAAVRSIRYVGFDALLAASDIISLHVPLLPETRHLLNPQTLAQTKPGVFIVNTSRGKLIDTAGAATILFQGGFPRSLDPHAARIAQTAIFHVQRNLEDVQAALYPSRTLLCDRGTVDGAAYWPGKPDEYFAAVGTTFDTELRRYDAVIFFESAALGGSSIEGGK